MNDNPSFVPALGRAELTGSYDRVIAVMTCERRWRTALLELIAPREGEVIVDIGAGTGSQAIAIKQRAPGARVIGVDPDPQVLGQARRKAQAAGVEIEWIEGYGDRVDALIGAGVADKAVSSLVLHQCDLEVKAAILAAMSRALVPGGRLAIADYGLQRTLLMRLLFRQVQALDGWERTGLNAKGVLPRLIGEAGFEGVEETRVIPTLTGSISLYAARLL
ncbi:MAG: class I SAM-dependent methyltransferase [Pseudomonadota bacterium]